MADSESYNLRKSFSEWMATQPKGSKLSDYPEDVREQLLNNNIKELRQIGLADEEIFEVLKVRFETEQGEEKKPVRKVADYLPIVEVLYLFLGGLFYYILLYTINAIIDGTFIFLEFVNKGKIATNFKIIQSTWILVLFLLIALVITIFIYSEKIVDAIKKTKITFWKILIVFLLFMGSIIFQEFLRFRTYPIIRHYSDYAETFSKYLAYKDYLADWLPLVAAICFVLLFYAYKKRNYFL